MTGFCRTTSSPSRPDSRRIRCALLWIAAMAVLTSAPCDARTPVEGLRTPAMVWDQENGLCGQITAVDGSGAVWMEAGCENGRPGLKKMGAATGTQLQALRLAFGTLPFEKPGRTPRECGGGRLLHTFSLLDGQNRRNAAACGSSSEFGDLHGLPDAFRKTAETFRNLW